MINVFKKFKFKSIPYENFPLIKETETDGWVMGIITEVVDAEGCTEGDAFVQLPNGSRAGLVWDVGEGETKIISKPTKRELGVYQIYFTKKIYNYNDLKENFKNILPELIEIISKVNK